MKALILLFCVLTFSCSAVKTAGDKPVVRNAQPEKPSSDISTESMARASFSAHTVAVPPVGKFGAFNPGTSASLWRDDFRNGHVVLDRRGLQVNDIITILIYDDSEATSDAKTDVSSKSGISATIEEFLGLPQYIFKRIDTYLKKDSQGNVDLTQPLVKGGSESFTKNEGKTSRKGKIKATISAFVVDVLPSGILKIQGEKRIKVNNEEQILVVTGFVRPEDVDSFNQVDSSRVAQARVEFLGMGSVSSPQRGGWLSNLVRDLWPF